MSTARYGHKKATIQVAFYPADNHFISSLLFCDAFNPAIIFAETAAASAFASFAVLARSTSPVRKAIVTLLNPATSFEVIPALGKAVLIAFASKPLATSTECFSTALLNKSDFG
ncbi:hypothetical protein ACUNE4_26325 [Serratia sp. IR-2025]